MVAQAGSFAGQLPLRDSQCITRTRVRRFFEDDPDAIADLDGIGLLSHDVAGDQDPGCVRERDQRDGVRHPIREERVHRLRDHRDAFHSTTPGAGEAAKLDALTGRADVFGRVLDVLASQTLLERQRPGREEVACVGIEGRQGPVLAEDALHAGLPNNTALPGQYPGPATTSARRTSFTWQVDSPRLWRTDSLIISNPWMYASPRLPPLVLNGNAASGPTSLPPETNSSTPSGSVNPISQSAMRTGPVKFS